MEVGAPPGDLEREGFADLIFLVHAGDPKPIGALYLPKLSAGFTGRIRPRLRLPSFLARSGASGSCKSLFGKAHVAQTLLTVVIRYYNSM